MTATNTILPSFNETIGKWITYLDDYTLAMLCQQPQVGSWSLGQVYTHLIDDTTYFIEQMKVALLDTTHTEKDMHEEAKTIFQQQAFPDVMIEGPATNTYIRQPQSKAALLQSLTTIKTTVNKLYATSDFSLSKGKSAHPALLFFTANQWLQFAEMHMRHHFRQKKRIDEMLFSS